MGSSPQLVEGYGEAASGALTISSTQTSKCKATDDAMLRGSYRLSDNWVIVRTTVKMNTYKCKGILSQIWGAKVLKIRPFHCPLHVLGSSNDNYPHIL